MSSLDSYLKPKHMSNSKLIFYMSKTLELSANAELLEPDELESKLIFFITRIVSVVSHGTYVWGKSESLSKFIYFSTQLISILSSMDLDSLPQSELISLIKQIVDFGNSVSAGWGPESQVVSLVTQMISLTRSIESDPEPEIVPLVAQIFYHLDSINSDSELLSLITQLFILAHRILTEGLDVDIRPSIIEVLSCRQSTYWDAKFLSYMTTMIYRFKLDLSPEYSLKSLITRIIFCKNLWMSDEPRSFHPLMTELISLISSMDLDSQPKPESEFISLMKQIISLVNSMDLDSQPKPESEFISLIKQIISLVDPEHRYYSRLFDLKQLMIQLKSVMFSQDFSLINSINEREWELMSLIYQIFSFGVSRDPNLKHKSLCPQAQVSFEKDNFHVIEGKFSSSSNNKWKCLPFNWEFFNIPGDKDFTLPGDEDFSYFKYQNKFYAHFHCPTCNGENHKEYSKVPFEIKHPLHPKHYLQLVWVDTEFSTRVCYCCDSDLMKIFYYCSSCDLAINIGCVEEPPILSIDHSKWHEQHSLTLFPRLTALNCSVCALTHSSCPFYMCPPCDFVVHSKCLSLPRVIKISRHRHRIYFTSFFDRGDRCCHICRRKINNDYGGYSCNLCLYVAHTRCGTQSNVWDGIDLEEVPEEVEEEELPPFETITDGIIEHFSHPNHYLILDQNTSRDYDEYKLCEACVMPIYFGNIYSCMECDFILHEKCANYPRKIEHPIHPHVLTLRNSDTERAIMIRAYISVYPCSACSSFCTSGYFYKCNNGGCNFVVHMGCCTISEPLQHPSHNHSLFLTSKPGEGRICSVCKKSWVCTTHETFNCVEEDCDFALCYDCATLPQTVRYKHDEHVLTLSYGEKTSTMTYWCESCEEKIDPKERFYRCDEYCCVTLHIDCMLGADLYMKPGSPWLSDSNIHTLANNHMSRPVCIRCKKRCPHKVFINFNGSIYCSSACCFQ